MNGPDPTFVIGSIVVVVLMLLLTRRGESNVNRNLVDSNISKGLLFEERKDYVQAKLALEAALKGLESGKPDMGQQITCCVHLGHVYEALGQPEQARVQFEQVLKTWRQQLDKKSINLVDIDYAVTNLDFGRGTAYVAEFYVDSIVAMKEKQFPKGHQDLQTSYKIGAMLLRKAGFKEEANLLEERGKPNSK